MLGVAGAVQTITMMLDNAEQRAAAVTVFGKLCELCYDQVWPHLIQYVGI